ncbi:17-beta-hydroxysteroid dehydrogenase type 6, partial [Stegodyphus mimosarum]
MFNTVVTHLVSLIFLSCIGFYTYDYIGSLYIILAAISSFLYISFLLASFVDNALPRFRVIETNKAVFITGCDTGFGHLLARRLDSLGYKVFAGCLNTSGKEIDELKYTCSSNLHIISLDVTQTSSVQQALKIVQNNLGTNELWAIVNNAGIIERGEAEWTPLEFYQKQFEVNTFGVVRVTQAFLPLLRKSKGRVITTTSVGGRYTFSGFVPYCMSKHATSSFCDGLRLEMAKFGVKVITVEPFSYKTAMTHMPTVLNSALNTWGKCPEELKKDVYDKKYLEAFVESVRKFNEKTALQNTNKVVDLLVESVCAISPHYSYVPGDLWSLLSLWFARRMPKTLADYLLRKTVTFDCDVERYLQDKALKKKMS